jgi:D-serine deaminase-like pyridoxal phosphate-dependent protein
MVDNEGQLEILEEVASKIPGLARWPVFVKIDVGSSRAGLLNSSQRLPRLVQRVQSSEAATLYGFYCHAGHSYGCRDRHSAGQVLHHELNAALEASKLVDEGIPLTLSIGSTPTAHTVQAIKGRLPTGYTLELHAGVFMGLCK